MSGKASRYARIASDAVPPAAGATIAKCCAALLSRGLKSTGYTPRASKDECRVRAAAASPHDPFHSLDVFGCVSQ